MPDLNPGARKALSLYWGAIHTAATQRLSTAETWQAIRDSATAQGLSSPGVSAAAVSVIRGYAGRMARATEAFGKADLGYQVTQDMIATPPWARPLAVQNAAPQYHVTYQRQALDLNGNLTTSWSTLKVSQADLTTVGDLTNLALQSARDMLAATPEEESPTREILGVSQLTVLAV